MKRITYLILLLSLIVYISTDDDDDDILDLSNLAGCMAVKSPSAKTCSEYKLTAEEKTKADSCCFMTNGPAPIDMCVYAIKKEVKDYIKEAKDEGYKNIKIDCSSNWLNFGISLILLVLFF